MMHKRGSALLVPRGWRFPNHQGTIPLTQIRRNILMQMLTIEELSAATNSPAAMLEGPHKLTIRSATQNVAQTKAGDKYEYLLLNVTDSAGNDHDGLKINSGLTKIELKKFGLLWVAATNGAALKGEAVGPNGLPIGKLAALKGRKVIAQILRVQDNPEATYTDSEGFKNEFAISTNSAPTFAKA